jgi:hypothetical protein
VTLSLTESGVGVSVKVDVKLGVIMGVNVEVSVGITELQALQLIPANDSRTAKVPMRYKQCPK